MLPSHFALGLDISKYDIRYDASVRRTDFVIQRASYGLRADERFEQLWADIQTVPLRGAYHYYSTGVSWRAQADHFLSVIAGRGYHFLALDYETYYNNLNAASANDAQRIMEHLRAETGLQILLYANPNVYETYLRPYGNWMEEWPLWISQWNSKWWHANRATGPRLPQGRTSWTIWQYGGDYQHPSGSWSVPGYGEGPAWGVQSKHVDLDMFNGGADEMRAWCGVADTVHESAPAEAAPIDAAALRLDELARMQRYLQGRMAELSS
jgi:GH25 family lysozyme M1 (1,4-beta-N-acetylmuramidase)